MSKLAAAHALLDHASHHQLTPDVGTIHLGRETLSVLLAPAAGESALYRLIVWARSLHVGAATVRRMAEHRRQHWIELHGKIRSFHGQPHPVVVAVMVPGAEHQALTTANVAGEVRIDALARHCRMPLGVGA